MPCMGPAMEKAPWRDDLVATLKHYQAMGIPRHPSPWHPMPFVCPNDNSVLEVHKHGMFCTQCEHVTTEAYDNDW